jgi:hydroxyquinol 1,2-dioxygenase
MIVRNFDENNITNAVLEKVGEASFPRVRALSGALVRHLHNFIREVEPTQEEWAAGIDFLTRVGKVCSDTRQEFILLSDTLGVSMLVDAINHRIPGSATQTTILGPFHVANAPEKPLGSFISEGLAGDKLLVEGTVRDAAGLPLAGAVVQVWHSDGDGYYDVQGANGLNNLMGRACFRTDNTGNFWFRTVVPSCYPIPHDGPVGEMLTAQGRHPYRPAHIHFMISASGCETLVTHVFLAGDPYLNSDVVFGVKDALIVELETQSSGSTSRGNMIDEPTRLLRYDFVLADRKQS